MKYLSTTMPARMALATLRNLSRSSRRRTFVRDLVNVDVSQSLTCSGTASLSVTSLSSSSSSHSRLNSHVYKQQLSIILYIFYIFTNICVYKKSAEINAHVSVSNIMQETLSEFTATRPSLTFSLRLVHDVT